MLRTFLTASAAALILKLCGVLTGIVAARALGPAGRGELAALLYLPSMLAAVGSLGIAQAVLLRARHDPISHNAVMRCGFYIAVTLGTVLAGVGAIAVVFVLPNEYRLVTLWAIAMLAYIPAQLVNWVLLSDYLGQQQFTTYYVLQLLPSVVYCAAMCGLVYGGGASGPSFAMACLLGHAVTTAVLLVIFRPATQEVRAIAFSFRTTAPFGPHASRSHRTDCCDPALGLSSCDLVDRP
jgi:O-antigen/teichoic acid export membrane protein